VCVVHIYSIALSSIQCNINKYIFGVAVRVVLCYNSILT
jgi:hypothetical protein